MNRMSKLLVALILSSLLTVLITGHGVAQSNWEGIFMDQFRVTVAFDDRGSGSLQMYDGANQIQNDGLIKVMVNAAEITFYIPAKQTNFKGEITESGHVISGNFIFPDGSLHPLTLNKIEITKTDAFEISRTEAVTDLHQLYSAIKQNHPRPFNYITPVEFERLYSSIAKIENETIQVSDFYLMAARLTEAIKCSHTGIRLPGEMTAEIKYEFPLKVYYADGNLYVIESPQQSIVPGSMITKINDLPIQEIIADLKLMIPVNGNNKTTRASIINRKFHTMLPLLDPSEEYLIEVNNNWQTAEFTMAANIKSATSSEFTEPVAFAVECEDLAYLTIPTFAISDMDGYFKTLENSFSQLHSLNTQNLVLDIRDNSGGHPIFAAQLLSYLTDQEFTYFTRNDEIPDFEPLYNPMQPKPNAFTGNVYVFVNGGCLSTSGHLVSLLKQYTRAKFIGEDPGSTYRCNDFSKKVVLTYSKLELNVPRTVFETKVEPAAMSRPFPIDYPVRVTLTDQLTGRDAYRDVIDKILTSDKVY
jgi:hypothetical protein